MPEEERKPYLISYKDLSNVLYYFTEDEVERLFRCTEKKHPCIIPGFGLLVTEDIRAIVLQLVTDEEPEDNPSYDPELSDEDKDWVRAIDLATKLHEEYDSKAKDDDDTDYEGGMMV